MAPSKVAVLLSTYNGEKYLDEFLASLYEQDCKEITLVVRDDNSSDKTLQILLRHQAQSKIKFQIIPGGGHLGPAHSFLDVLSKVDGDFDYYAFCDQDDVWLPNKISRAVTSLRPITANIPALYCSRLEYVDEGLRHLQWSKTPHNIGFGNALVENIAQGCTIVMNQVARKTILSGLPEKCLMHDWWSYLVISCFGQIVFDEYAGVKYRLHNTNAVGATTTFAEGLKRRVRRFLKHGDGVFRISEQAASFMDIFGDKIPEEKTEVLKLTISSKSSIGKRLRLAASRDIWRQNKVDDMLLRGLIIINHY